MSNTPAHITLQEFSRDAHKLFRDPYQILKGNTVVMSKGGDQTTLGVLRVAFSRLGELRTKYRDLKGWVNILAQLREESILQMVLDRVPSLKEQDKAFLEKHFIGILEGLATKPTLIGSYSTTPCFRRGVITYRHILWLFLAASERYPTFSLSSTHGTPSFVIFDREESCITALGRLATNIATEITNNLQCDLNMHVITKENFYSQKGFRFNMHIDHINTMYLRVYHPQDRDALSFFLQHPKVRATSFSPNCTTRMLTDPIKRIDALRKELHSAEEYAKRHGEVLQLFPSTGEIGLREILYKISENPMIYMNGIEVDTPTPIPSIALVKEIASGFLEGLTPDDIINRLK